MTFSIPIPLQSTLNSTRAEHFQLGTLRLRVSMPILGTMEIGSKEWVTWVMEEEEGL
jgi:hypothetical protein